MVDAAEEMRVFNLVMQTGSFTAAATELGLSPSAVSKTISRIEDRLGVKLLARTTRRLSLTSEGELYLSGAREILDAIEGMEAAVSHATREPAGVLRINSGPTFGRHRLMHVLPEFLARYPKIDLRLDITDRHVDLATEQVDVAIRTGPMPDSRLIARTFMQASRTICASPAYIERHGRPATPQDLARHHCLLISGATALGDWPFEAAHGAYTIRIRPRTTSDNADLVRDMALAGMGIARLVHYTVEDALNDGRLVPLLEDCHSRQATPISAVTLPERQKTPRVRAFVAFLVEKFGAPDEDAPT